MYYNKNYREIRVRFTLLLTLFNYEPSLAQVLPGLILASLLCSVWNRNYFQQLGIRINPSSCSSSLSSHSEKGSIYASPLDPLRQRLCPHSPKSLF